MNPDTVRRPSDVPNPGTIDFPTPTPQPDGAPTLPSDAESLLKHLRLGVPRPRAGVPAVGFPHIPNYAIESELGRGGMGVVYLARHATLHHTVAVKMILAAAHASPNEVARFVAEAEAVAAVKHPNVVQVHDLGESDGRPYFVMEYVEGGSLAGHLKSGPLDPHGAAALIEAVARGAQAAHDAGIVHRDLKSANILLSAEPGARSAEQKAEDGPVRPASGSALRAPGFALRPKVSDFGLAKRLLSDVTRSIAVLGTPAYMAPEQAGGRAKFVGPQADVYALGVILYECLTGRVPFDAGDPWALIQLVLETPPEPPRRRAPGVPRDLELICLKCLEKEPHHRYPTAAALADDLARFRRGEPVSVRPIGAPTRVLRWTKKRPAAAALSALGVLLLLTVPPLTVWILGRFSQRAAVAEGAQQKEEAARRAEAEANRARAEEEKARIAAEQLADARELFGLQNKFRNRAAARPLGWTAATRAEVPRARALAGGGPQAVEDLRSTAAGALLAHDLFPLEPAAKLLSGSVLATDPKSGVVAVGEFKSWGDCRVLLVDPASGRTVRQLTFPTTPLVEGGLVQDGTRALAFSPDGTRLYVGTRSSKVMRFDLGNPKNTPAAWWKAATHTLEQLAVSPDGKTVYGLCPPEVPVFAWAADTGKPLPSRFPDETAPIKTFAVLAGGDLIAGNGRKLYRWKADGTLVRSVPNAPCFRLATVSGSMLLLGEGSQLDVFDGETFESTARFTDPHLRRAVHEGYVRSIVVHPSAAFVATAADDSDRAVKVWELASGRLVGIVTSAGTGPVAVAWSGDGACLLATAEGRVERWRFAPAEAQRFACFAGPPLEAAAFAPGGRVAAVGAALRGRRELLVGAAAGGPSPAVYLTDPSGNGQAGLAAAPTGTLAVTAQNPGIWLRKPGGPVAEPAFTRQTAKAPRFDPDGGALWAVIDSKTVRRYDSVTTAELGRWSSGIANVVSGLASLDSLEVGRKVAVAGGRDGAIHLLNPTTCEPTASFRNAGDPVTAVALAPDEAFAVGGTQSGKLRVVGIADNTERPAVVAHAGGVTAVAIGRDGTVLATGGRDRSVRLWKKTGDRFESLLTISDLPGVVSALQFNSVDGRLLVLLASEHAVRVWDVGRLNAQLTELKLGW